MILKDAVIEDRQKRRKFSRRKYGEVVGLTEGRIHALEHGRKVKPGEIEALVPFLGDLLDPELVAATLDAETTPPVQPRGAVQRPQTEQDVSDFERTQLAYAYIEVMKRLGTRVPTLPWPSQYRLETAPPIDFQPIREWIQEVGRWLDEQDKQHIPNPYLDAEAPEEIPIPDPVPDPDPPASQVVVEEIDDEDEEEWEDVVAEEVPNAEDFEIPVADPVPMPQPALTVADPSLVLPQPMEFVFDPNTWYVTNGERTTFLECQRRWYLESYLSLGSPVRKVTGAAATGTRYHRALATWYQPVPGDPWATFEADRKNDLEYLEDTGASDALVKDFHQEVDLVRAMIEGYFQWVEETGSDVGLQVIAPEAVISAHPQFPDFPHVRLLAKLDVRVVDQRDMSRWFMDHKTVQDFTSAMRTLRLDEQMLHYHLIEWLKLAEEGLDSNVRAGGAYFNMARKVKRTSTAKPPFFQREPVPHSVTELRSYWQRVLGSVEQMASARARLDAGQAHQQVCPPHPTRDCAWKCEFYTVCSMLDDGSAGVDDYMNEQLVKINPLARYEPEAVGETV